MSTNQLGKDRSSVPLVPPLSGRSADPVVRLAPKPATDGSAVKPALLLAILVLAALLPLRCLAERAQTKGSPAPVQHYQPDLQTCTPERLLAAYSNALTPYADQPPAVLEQLRGLQRQLSARSLGNCLEQGLLSSEQVEKLMAAMGMAVPAPAPLPKDSPVLAAPKPAPAAPSRLIVKPAALKPTVVKPATVPPRSGPSSNPKPSAFDMSPIEWNPARTTPIDPKAQEDPSSPR